MLKRFNFNNTNYNYNSIVVIVFILYSLFITGLPTNEILLGGDWSFPSTLNQVEEWLNSMSYTWYGLNLGARNIGQSSLYLIYLEKFITLFISPAIFISSLVVLSISFMGINIYILLRFFKINSISSFIAGIIYMSSPIVFNYTIMGWIYVLFAMALLPLAIMYFIKAIEKNNMFYTALVALLITISIQSQTIIWFFIIAIILSLYLVNKNNIYIYTKSIFLLIFFFFLLNAYYILNLFVLPSQAVMSSNIVNSAVSVGAAGNFHPINFIRLFGAMFNNQYEYIIEQSFILTLFSFFSVVIIFVGYFYTKIKKLYLVFLIISIIPIVLYFLNFNRELLYYIPFSNVIRDFGRFTVLTTLAYSILIAFSLDGIMKSKNKNLKNIIVGIMSLYLISLYPWYSNQLLNWKKDMGSHQILRTKAFSGDYKNVEKLLLRNRDNGKVIYLPFSSNIDFEDDPKYHGMFQEAQDIFASYSPITGHIILNDRNLGYSDNFLRILNKKLTNNFLKLINLTNIKYIVFRKNLKLENKQIVLIYLNNNINNEKLKVVYEGKKIVVYEIINPKSHIYATTYKPEIIENFNIIKEFNFKDPFIVKSQNSNIANTIDFINNLKESKLPIINYKKINSAKYKIEVRNTTNTYLLNFLESFHELWKVYIKPMDNNKNSFYETFELKEVLYDKHILINGYANSWMINNDDLCKNNALCKKNSDNSYDYDLIIEFYPQQYYYIGMAMTLMMLLLMFIYFIYTKTRRKI